MDNSIRIKRKCECCKEEVLIGKENISDFIYYDKKTYHSKCFTNVCKKRMVSKRSDVSVKWEKIYNSINSIQSDSFTHFMSSLVKEDIFYFIQYSYDITVVPSSVWQRIADINSGNYKTLHGNGIPIEHLYDMWTKKIDMLNSIYSQNVASGNKMDTTRRLNYDLAILVNKYDSYKKWLEKKRINDIENETIKSDTLVHEMHIQRQDIQNTKDNEDDISSLVDDIFG